MLVIVQFVCDFRRSHWLLWRCVAGGEEMWHQGDHLGGCGNCWGRRWWCFGHGCWQWEWREMDAFERWDIIFWYSLLTVVPADDAHHLNLESWVSRPSPSITHSFFPTYCPRAWLRNLSSMKPLAMVGLVALFFWSAKLVFSVGVYKWLLGSSMKCSF